MKATNTNALLASLIENTKTNIEKVKNEFMGLSDEELSSRPGQDQWSILECIQHLNIANEHYYTEIEKQLNLSNSAHQADFKSGFLGSYFTKSMKPKPNGTIPNKMKTMKKFVPSSNLERTIIDQFIHDQEHFLALLDRSKKAHLEKIKIKSAIGSWLMFKLGDAFLFVNAHTDRHLLQAKNVLKSIQVV